MKKYFIVFPLLVLLCSTTVFANDPDVDPRIVSAFQREFSFAKDVKWDVDGEFTKASFSFYDHGVIAFYNTEAELVSIARNILYMQLPLSIITSLEREYAGAEFLGITEVSRNGDTKYLLTILKKGKRYLMKATPSGNVEVLKRIN